MNEKKRKLYVRILAILIGLALISGIVVSIARGEQAEDAVIAPECASPAETDSGDPDAVLPDDADEVPEEPVGEDAGDAADEPEAAVSDDAGIIPEEPATEAPDMPETAAEPVADEPADDTETAVAVETPAAPAVPEIVEEPAAAPADDTAVPEAVNTAAEAPAEKEPAAENSVAENTVAESSADENAVQAPAVAEAPVPDVPVAEAPVPEEPAKAPVERKVITRSTLETMERVYLGSEIIMTAELIGFDDVSYSVQWLYSPDGENWFDAPEGNELVYTYTITEENYLYYWSIRVDFQED